MKPLPHISPLSLSRVGIDRDHRTRGSDGDLAEVWASHPSAVFEHRGSLLVASGGLFHGTHDHVPVAQTEIYLGQDAEHHRYIGISLDDAGRSVLDTALAADRDRDAADLLVAPGSGLDSLEPIWLPLRELAEVLSDVDVNLACELVGLGNWHRAHRFSARNGAPTEPAVGGWVRKDPETGSEHFPRTDPAVITAVVNTDADGVERILLGNNAAWTADRYSLLAGFVEPGETLEDAVRREIFEEAQIAVVDPTYLGSQPWPFPCSLMLGFSAVAPSLDAHPDLEEIASLRWFTREELRNAMAEGSVRTAGLVSISGQILHSWLENG